MAKPTKKDYLKLTYAAYHYIYNYAKDFDGDDLFDDEKTVFALGYLLDQFTWGIKNILTDEFRNRNSEMQDLFWLMLAASGARGDGFTPEEIPDVIFGDFNLVDFFPTFQKVYQRELRRPNTTKTKQKEDKNQKEEREWDTVYKYPIHTRHSIWTVKKR